MGEHSEININQLNLSFTSFAIAHGCTECHFSHSFNPFNSMEREHLPVFRTERKMHTSVNFKILTIDVGNLLAYIG